MNRKTKITIDIVILKKTYYIQNLISKMKFKNINQD